MAKFAVGTIESRHSVVAVAFLALLLAFAGWGRPAQAHEIRPAIASLDLATDGVFELRVSTNLEALIAAIGPQHQDSSTSPNAAEYNRLRDLPPEQLEAAFAAFSPVLRAGIVLAAPDGATIALEQRRVIVPGVGDTSMQRASLVIYAGRIPAGAASLTWRFDAAFGPSVIRAQVGGGEVFFSDYVPDGEASAPIPLQSLVRESAWAVFADYAAIGFTHIVPRGLDHILFVVGLFLLSPHLRPLLLQVTCFTVAHSITLALGMLGVLSVPPSIVEPLVALSIVYVGIENVFTSHLSRWRPVIVFLFGLLHGLGFAGILAQIGLAQGDFLVGLLAFNVGVELGQLAIIGGCFLSFGIWFGGERWYRAWVTVPASLCISAIAAVWFVQRVV